MNTKENFLMLFIKQKFVNVDFLKILNKIEKVPVFIRY